MTATVLLGWALTLIGLFFRLLAFAAASKNVFRRAGMAPESDKNSRGLAAVLRYLAVVLQALGQLPNWTARFLAGLILIFFGQRLVNGQSLFGF